MRNQWSARRRGVILLIVIGALLVIVGIPTYFASRAEPNCGNGVMDGDESGVDCGGGCQLLCTPEVLPIISRGDARLLKIATSTYEIAILLENPNAGGIVERAPYTFSVYSGTERTPVRTFERETFVDKGQFALFEGPFVLEGAGPFRAAFEWGELVWEKNEEPKPIIAVEDTNIIDTEGSGPRLEARLENRSQDDVSNVEVVALLYDASGNMVAAGKTFIDSLGKGEAAPIVFSWPEPFAREPVSTRIFPHPLPDKSYVR